MLNTIGVTKGYKPTDPELAKIYDAILSGRKPHQRYLCSALGISSEEYKDWLSALFMLLIRPENGHPNFLETMVKGLYENPSLHIMVSVYIFEGEHRDKYCLLSDRSFSMPLPEDQATSFDFNLCSNAFIRYIFVNIEKAAPREAPPLLLHAYKNMKKSINVQVIRSDLSALGIYNKHVIYQCKKNVYCGTKDLSSVIL